MIPSTWRAPFNGSECLPQAHTPGIGQQVSPITIASLELASFITVGIIYYTNSVLQITLPLSCTASPAALAGCPEQYSKSRSGVSECDRVVSGPMLDQAIKRGFIAENKLNQVAEFSLVDQLSPLGGLSLTSSPPVAPSVSKGVVWTL